LDSGPLRGLLLYPVIGVVRVRLGEVPLHLFWKASWAACFGVFAIGSSYPIFADRCVTEIIKTLKLPASQSLYPRIPQGVESEAHLQLLQIFRTDPSFADADVIVLYGSRTHFGVGYEARQDSDLDVSIFYRSSDLERAEDYPLDRMPEVNARMRSVALRTGFDISEQVPRFDSFDQFLEQELKTEGFKDNMRSQRILDVLAKEGNWDEDVRRSQYLAIKGEHWFNQEAIFIFKTDQNLAERVIKLRKIGYQNFYLLANGSHKGSDPR